MYLLKLGLALVFMLALFMLIPVVGASNTSFYSIGNSQSYSFSIFGSIWQDITNVISHIFSSFAPATTTIPITTTNKTPQTIITTTITPNITTPQVILNSSFNKNSTTAPKQNYHLLVQTNPSTSNPNGYVCPITLIGNYSNPRGAVIELLASTECQNFENYTFVGWSISETNVNGTYSNGRWIYKNYSNSELEITNNSTIIKLNVFGNIYATANYKWLQPSTVKIVQCSNANQTYFYLNNTICPSNCPFEYGYVYGSEDPGSHACFTGPLPEVNITSTILIMHNINTDLNSSFGIGNINNLRPNENSSMGTALFPNETVSRIVYKTPGFTPVGEGFSISPPNGYMTTYGLDLNFKTPNQSYTGQLEVVVDYTGSPPGQITSSSTSTSTTSTVITTSTTTMPQIKYYTLNIIRTPNLSQQTNIGTFVYCYPNPQPGNNYSEQANSLVNLSAPLSCNLPQTGVEYYFSRWVGSGLGSKNSTNPNVTINMKGNITETAEYQINSSITIPSTSTTTTSTTNTTTSPSTTTTQPIKPVYYSLYVKTLSNSGSVSQSGNGTYLAGSRVLISAKPSNGEVFEGWLCFFGDAPTIGEMGVVCNNGNGYSGSSLNATITINSNITEIATWASTPPAPLNRSLTITSNPSDIGAQGVIRYQHSMHLVQELSNTTKYSNNASVNISVVNIPSGWQFTSWSCSGTGCYSGNSGEFNLTMNNNITETENFAPIYYTLNEKIVSPDNCGSVSQSGNGAYRSGIVVQISATPTQTYPPSGCEFEGWYASNSNGYSGSSPNATIIMNSDITETAYWSYRPPQVTMVVNVTPYVTNINQSLIGGYAEIYDKYGLYGTTCFTSNDTTTGWSGEQNTCPMRMTQGDPVTISVVPYPGWKFNGWTGSSYTGMFQSTNISGASSIETAHFIPVKSYYLIINSTACGWPFCTSPSSGSYSFFPGYHVNINAVSGFSEGNSNYNFANWSGSGIGSYTGPSRSINITMNSNITETVKYLR